MASALRRSIFPCSKRLLLLVTFSLFIWTVVMFNLMVPRTDVMKESERLKEQIIDLSKEYVRALAQENKNIVDGPFAGRMTAYDLKKTLAVLLENILERLGRLEEKVDSAILNGSLRSDLKNCTNQSSGIAGQSEGQESYGALELIVGVNEGCGLNQEQLILFPSCLAKVKWMHEMWQSDPCYKEHGVDGSECSFVIYLSEVENFCPRLPWRPLPELNQKKEGYSLAQIQEDKSGLFTLLKDDAKNYNWMKNRLERMWPKWVAGVQSLAQKDNMTIRYKKKILVHLGFLTSQSGFKFADKTDKGGPLGEMVQWSDVLASLFILGHELIITSQVDSLMQFLQQDPHLKSGCPPIDGRYIDLIFTDIVGLAQLKAKIKGGFGKYSCLLRVLDSFGTEPMFNYEHWAPRIKGKNPWGKHGLLTRQFFTLYPHTPDNSFMGFVVETHTDPSEKPPIRRDQAIVYGKEAYMWDGARPYLDTVHELVEVHATVGNVSSPNIPSYIVNHGILPPKQLHALLRQSKLFIGLGFPYEGPAPLEAIANGCIYINPKFVPPRSRKTTKFFGEKPTYRELRSQNPYAEDFIGIPHVFTVDIRNKEEVRKILTVALTTKVEPYLPYEFTVEGMLQRVNAYLEHQDFCVTNNNWPPEDSMVVLSGRDSLSCKDLCTEQGLICEGSFFHLLNNRSAFQRAGINCTKERYVEDIIVPYVEPIGQECSFQKQPLLFSCAEGRVGAWRLCPCRDFIPGQTSLCKLCI